VRAGPLDGPRSEGVAKPDVSDIIDNPDRQPVHVSKDDQIVDLGTRKTCWAADADAI